MKEATVEDVLRALQEFVFIWISQILFHRNIYRSELFSKVISFDLIVYRSRHPKVNDYLTAFVQRFLRAQLEGSTSGQIGALYVMLYSTKSMRIREKYLLRFTDLASMDFTQLPTTLSGINSNQEPMDTTLVHIDGLHLDEIYSQFKSVLFRHCEELQRLTRSQVQPTENLFFKLVIDANDLLSLQELDNSWVRISIGQLNKEDIDEQQTRVILIGDTSLGILNFNISNEYSA